MGTVVTGSGNTLSYAWYIAVKAGWRVGCSNRSEKTVGSKVAL